MKFLILMFLPCLAFAAQQPCDEKVAAVANYRTALEFLKPYNGRFMVGNCKVELHTCDPTNTKAGIGSLAGDILITDSEGVENYTPLHFVIEKSNDFYGEVYNSRTMFNYHSMGTINNPVTGAREEYRLEILKKWKGDDLGQITMGTYNTKRDLIHMDQYTYRWSECFN